ncbi:MAG: hypothetical protein HQK53_02510 [Oligoflexia bacterium]|nr:hypothetical protein [Oligoflexia bacterium]
MSFNLGNVLKKLLNYSCFSLSCRGTSLIETMIAVIMLSGITVGAIQLSKTNLNVRKNISFKNDWYNQVRTVTYITKNIFLCNLCFQGQPTVKNYTQLPSTGSPLIVATPVSTPTPMPTSTPTSTPTPIPVSTKLSGAITSITTAESSAINMAVSDNSGNYMQTLSLKIKYAYSLTNTATYDLNYAFNFAVYVKPGPTPIIAYCAGDNSTVYQKDLCAFSGGTYDASATYCKYAIITTPAPTPTVAIEGVLTNVVSAVDMNNVNTPVAEEHRVAQAYYQLMQAVGTP